MRMSLEKNRDIGYVITYIPIPFVGGNDNESI
jgi:hypothetical protein